MEYSRRMFVVHAPEAWSAGGRWREVRSGHDAEQRRQRELAAYHQSLART